MNGVEIYKNFINKQKKFLILRLSDGLDNTLNQILRGLNSVVVGIAALSNQMGDRHSRTYKPQEHHAHLIVNSAFTLCEFIIGTYEYQKSKKS
jgi:hypothetical protein